MIERSLKGVWKLSRRFLYYEYSAYEKIFVFGQVAENEYIFNIHIPSYCKDRIHLIFVFDKQPGYEHN